MSPLSHHEILAIVAPFTRTGRHVDLSATDRMERRLIFRPRSWPPFGPEALGLSEVLELANPEPGRYQLTRRLHLSTGPVATLESEGADPAALLARIDAILPDRQFLFDGAVQVACLHRLPVESAMLPSAVPALLLSGAEARAGGLILRLRLSRVRGMPADIHLDRLADDALRLPEDLLAILGWRWSSRLAPGRDGWTASLRVPRREPLRSAAALAGFAAAVRHVAATLAAPPAAFHARHAVARWRVAGRRGLPLLASGALLGAALALPRLHLGQDSALRMLIFNAPPVLLVLMFSLRELPRIEIPPIPRPDRRLAWRPAPGGGRAAQPNSAGAQTDGCTVAR